MDETVRYASPESQYDGAGEVPGDTEEMFWLRMQDDYASRLKLGNLLVRQYRYREAVGLYRMAERIRRDDPMLYLRLGGACLTLFRFEDALAASLREVEAPVLLIWGEDDKWHHVESSNLYRSALPNAALTVVRNAGHLVHEEKPDRIYELVRSFIPAGYGIDD